MAVVVVIGVVPRRKGDGGPGRDGEQGVLKPAGEASVVLVVAAAGDPAIMGACRSKDTSRSQAAFSRPYCCCALATAPDDVLKGADARGARRGQGRGRGVG